MFKVGDTVILITDKNLAKEAKNYAKMQGLFVGEKYLVDHIEGQYILIKCNNMEIYHPIERFKLVTVNKKSHLPEWW